MTIAQIIIFVITCVISAVLFGGYVLVIGDTKEAKKLSTSKDYWDGGINFSRAPKVTYAYIGLVAGILGLAVFIIASVFPTRLIFIGGLLVSLIGLRFSSKHLGILEEHKRASPRRGSRLGSTPYGARWEHNYMSNIGRIPATAGFIIGVVSVSVNAALLLG